MTDFETRGPRFVVRVIEAGVKDAQIKPKAWVISGPSKPRAQVVHVSAEGKAGLPLPRIGTPGAEDALRFAREYRQFASLQPTDGFTPGTTLDEMARRYRLAPIRFIFELRRITDQGRSGHLMLYLHQVSPNYLRVYDPVRGVRDLALQQAIHKIHEIQFNNPDTEAKRGPERVEAIGESSSRDRLTDTTKVKARVLRVTERDLLNPPPEEAYRINEDPLLKLGPLQRSLYDCGPICVYAGLVGRGQI